MPREAITASNERGTTPMAEWNASEYSQQSSLQAAMAAEQLGRFLLQGNERVLDVGCGDGKITAEIAKRLPRGSVLGVDPSRNMIEFANQNYGLPALQNLRFEVADARHLPYRREFDRVVSFNALHWVPEQALALRSIHNALEESGLALLRFVPEGERKSLEDVIEDVRRSTRWASNFTNFQKPYAHFSPEDYQQLATQNGFEVIRTEVEDRAWDFKTRKGFIAFARATFVEWTQHIPEGNGLAFVTEVLDRYQDVAASNSQEANTFKFYQLEVVLEAV
jgi:trans-aconitate methyltransferase